MTPARQAVILRQTAEAEGFRYIVERRHLTDAANAIEQLVDGIRYWSYCMDLGMRNSCPEKVEELAGFLMSCGIAPYHIRNNALETVAVSPRPENAPADPDSEEK